MSIMLGRTLTTIFVIGAIPILTICSAFNATAQEEQQQAAFCPNLRRFCLSLDLKDDPNLITEYEKYHRDVWPEIKESILSSGVKSLEIYRIMNRLFMIMEVDDSFSFEKKSEMDAANPKVQEWEELMWKFQQALPIAKPGQKWIMMDKIYDLRS